MEEGILTETAATELDPMDIAGFCLRHHYRFDLWRFMQHLGTHQRDLH
jgi:hypothetical protein